MIEVTLNKHGMSKLRISGFYFKNFIIRFSSGWSKNKSKCDVLEILEYLSFLEIVKMFSTFVSSILFIYKNWDFTKRDAWIKNFQILLQTFAGKFSGGWLKTAAQS